MVDNTNPTLEDRAALVGLARAAEVPVRAVWVDMPFETSVRRNLSRDGRTRVPSVGLLAIADRFVAPTLAEGFDSVTVVGP